MHNDEGKLFDAVFNKLLALGIVIASVAVVVWIVWAIVRTSAITNEVSQQKADCGAEMLPGYARAGAPLLANIRSAKTGVSAERGDPGPIIELLLGPVTRGLAVLDKRLDTLPGLVADAAFFSVGPS